MSFLESVQHGLEKASQEAARIAKIQHLHGVANDLAVKMNQESYDIINKVMELFQSGHLTQNELLPLCQQIITYQQQIAEVQAEIQKIQDEAHPQAASSASAPVYPPAGSPAAPPPPPPAPITPPASGTSN